MPDAESNLQAAERVVSLLAENGVPAVVIGAVALAAYRYVRHTEDFEAIRDTCRRYRLHGLDAALEELG